MFFFGPHSFTPLIDLGEEKPRAQTATCVHKNPGYHLLHESEAFGGKLSNGTLEV